MYETNSSIVHDLAVVVGGEKQEGRAFLPDLL